MSGDDFLEELKKDFLNEALFMMEQYEESMLALESSQEPQEHIGRIFRVAHSIKGGAAAVGFEDLSRFAHKAEDLLSILRVSPEKINTEIITLFLAVGDQFKIRLLQLQSGSSEVWEVEELTTQLLHWIKLFQVTGDAPETKEASQQKSTEEIDFSALAAPNAEPAEDVANYELIAQLEAEMRANGIDPHADEAKPETSAAASTEAPPQVVKKVEEKAVETTAQSKETSQKKVAQAENTILKVDSLRVDAVLDVVGEIVVLKNQLLHSEAIQLGQNQRLNFIVDQLDKSIRDLYEKTLGIRMTPLKSLFMKLQRTVRDVSVKLQKPVDLQLIGEETEVDRSVFELLGDPLMHMARNAMDHGIETPDERAAAQKPAMARLTIAAKQVGASVLIEISEDGRGIYRDKVLKKALEKGLIPSHRKPEEMSDEEVYQLLFAPGFSTAEKVTDLSGRGVGLDVVKSNIEKAKGQVRIKSSPGKGTTFEILIPLTTSITDGIVVAICGQRYMVPIHSIREIVQFRDHEITQVANVGQVLKIRNRLTPVIDFRASMGETQFIEPIQDQSKKPELNTYVVIESASGLSALQVDEVIGQAQVVAKPLQIGQSIPEFSGAATLGDGRTILILEPNVISQTKVSAA